jgi:anoctamin-10/anoctamin-7
VDRLKLIDSIINNHSVGGCYLNMAMLAHSGCVKEYAPLHDEVRLRELEEKWIKLFQLPWLQATAAVKDYFGEKIGLYFLWLGHYTTWCMLSCVLGVVAYGFVQANSANPNSLAMPYFAGIMALWTAVYVFCYTIVLPSFLVCDDCLCLSLIHLLLHVCIL